MCTCRPSSCTIAHLAPLPSASCFLLPCFPSGMSMAWSPRGSSGCHGDHVTECIGERVVWGPLLPLTPPKAIAEMPNGFLPFVQASTPILIQKAFRERTAEKGLENKDLSVDVVLCPSG